MTNEELIAKIKAEIERQLLEKDHGFEDGEAEYGYNTCLKDMRRFLSTLESEKPMQEGLEEEISRYIDDERNKPTHEYGWNVDDIQKCARHFAQWGAEHAREQMMKEAVEVCNVVEEGRYCQEIGPIFLDERAGFKPGDKVRVIVLKKED